MNESQSVTQKTPQDVILQKQREQLKSFGDILNDCIGLDFRRHPERAEEMRAIKKQFLSDARYRVQNTLPPDIADKAKAEAQK